MQSEKINFVKTTAKDWPTILDFELSEIENQIYKPIIDINELKKYFSKSVIYKVLFSNRLVGYCAYELNDDEAEITALLVLKEFRNKGVGKIMMNKMLDDLKSIKKIKVITSPKNIFALRIYQKNGFVIKERIENYWKGEPRLILYLIK
jgi:ribosomal protein S18 acetylase RimI-like enzyme